MKRASSSHDREPDDGDDDDLLILDHAEGTLRGSSFVQFISCHGTLSRGGTL